jgi:protein-disulfide isomerase
MLKKILIASSVVGVLMGGAVACQPPGGGSKELVERIEKLEKKVEALEKRPAGPQAPQPPPPQTAAYDLKTGASPVLGKKDAKVTLMIWSDYQCPFCSKVEPMLRDVVADPDLKDKVNVVYKQFPLSFHQNARPASKAALAVRELGGDQKFWDFSKKMFENQRDLSPDNYTKWAVELGIDKTKFENALKNDDAKFEQIIKDESDQGSNMAKVRGTPSLFVNGWELRTRSVDGVKQLIKEKNLG